MKIVTIIGTRPQYVKAAVMSRCFRDQTDIQEVMVDTGQHYDASLSDIFYEQMEIPMPKYHLGIGSGNHGEQTAKMISGIEQVLISERPDYVLLYGDTNSTLAGAITAAKMHIPIIHIESGLRSFNKKMPEEINRILTDHCADLLFCPTKTAVENLLREGISQKKIHFVGDIMYDAALYFSEKAQKQSNILSAMSLMPGKYILATLHRAENTNVKERLLTILSAFHEIAGTLPIILPLHPRTRKIAAEFNPKLFEESPIKFIEPVGYLDMITLEKNAAVIVTDSGGIQKEALFYQVPCVTLRDETEWVETIMSGWNILVPPISIPIIVSSIIGSIGHKGNMIDLFGNGASATEIISVIRDRNLI